MTPTNYIASRLSLLSYTAPGLHNRRGFFGRFGRALAGAALIAHLKFGELVPVPLSVVESDPWATETLQYLYLNIALAADGLTFTGLSTWTKVSP